MNREEAIDLLQKYKEESEEDYYVRRAEALDMAIKALQQEPCADMVSRDAMWDVLQRLYGTEGELVEELMSLPPVLPMPKMGRWIGVNPMVDTLMCSECGENIISEEFKSNYCPNCGCKMWEVENGCV